MVQACNVVEYNGNGTGAANQVFSTQSDGEGTPPCAFTVTGANGGNVILTDSAGQQFFRAIPAPTSAATTVSALTRHPCLHSRARYPSEHAALALILFPPSCAHCKGRVPLTADLCLPAATAASCGG